MLSLPMAPKNQRETDPDQRIGGAEEQAVADGLGDLYELEPEVTHGLVSPRLPAAGESAGVARP